MTISYKWLSEYLPVTVEPERLSRILTSIGLEVESMHDYAEAKGGLKGLVIGEVLSTEKHPNADKLTLTKVNIGKEECTGIIAQVSDAPKMGCNTDNAQRQHRLLSTSRAKIQTNQKIT